MWAAVDDQWAPDFVAELYASLQENPRVGFAFCGMDIVNLNDQLIARLATFSRFTSTWNRYAVATRFLSEDELCGKSDAIYGLNRRHTIVQTIDRRWGGRTRLDDLWSANVVFVLAAIMRFGFVCVDKVMFRSEKTTIRIDWVSYRPRWYSRGLYLNDYSQYTAALRDAVDDPTLKELVTEVMQRRRRKEILVGKPLRPVMKIVERAVRWSQGGQSP